MFPSASRMGEPGQQLNPELELGAVTGEPGRPHPSRPGVGEPGGDVMTVIPFEDVDGGTPLADSVLHFADGALIDPVVVVFVGRSRSDCPC